MWKKGVIVKSIGWNSILKLAGNLFLNSGSSQSFFLAYTLIKFVQFKNALFPILLTLDNIVTLVKSEQFKKSKQTSNHIFKPCVYERGKI